MPGPHLLYQEGHTPSGALRASPQAHSALIWGGLISRMGGCSLSFIFGIPLPCERNKITFKSYYAEGRVFYGPMEATGGTFIEFPLLVKLVLQLNSSGKKFHFSRQRDTSKPNKAFL